MAKLVVIAAVLAAQIALPAYGASQYGRDGAKVLLNDGNKITYSLRTGQSVLIVALPHSGPFDRLVFVNENWSARGRFQIAIAGESLAPSSAKWRTVEGAVSFAHKRVFSVSLLGTQAKYVRLSFQVEPDPSPGSNRQS